jgi:hypothetical protein
MPTTNELANAAPAIPVKRGRKPNTEKSFTVDGVEYELQTADKKFTLLLEPAEQETIEAAFLKFVPIAQNDPVLAEVVRTKHKGNWDPVLNRNQMLKHAVRLYFRTLGINFDLKPVYVPKPAAPEV